MDLLNDAAIISINGDEFVGLEGEEFVRTVSSQLNMDANAVQRLYYHYMGGNETLKSSILAVPHILNKGEIIQPWRKGHNKRMQTGIMAAPISIGGVWYLCCVVSTKNAQKKTAPYSIRLFDRSKIEEMIGSNIVHDGTEATSQPSDTSNSNPLTVAKVLQKYLLANYSQENNENDNNNLRTENKQHKTRYNMKKTIRLSESDLHRVIRESVKRVLREEWKPSQAYWTDPMSVMSQDDIEDVFNEWASEYEDAARALHNKMFDFYAGKVGHENMRIMGRDGKLTDYDRNPISHTPHYDERTVHAREMGFH